MKNTVEVQELNAIVTSDRVAEIIEGNIVRIIVAKDTAATPSRQVQDLKC